MTRYQIYLNPNDVKTFDDLASQLAVSRSHLIRDIISRASREYEKILKATKKIPLKNHPLMKMSGIIKTAKPGIAENIDDIYLKD